MPSLLHPGLLLRRFLNQAKSESAYLYAILSEDGTQIIASEDDATYIAQEDVP